MQNQKHNDRLIYNFSVTESCGQGNMALSFAIVSNWIQTIAMLLQLYGFC